MPISEWTDQEIDLFQAARAAQNDLIDRLAYGIYENVAGVAAAWAQYQIDTGEGGQYEEAAGVLNRRFAGGVGAELVQAINKCIAIKADLEAAAALRPGLLPPVDNA